MYRDKLGAVLICRLLATFLLLVLLTACDKSSGAVTTPATSCKTSTSTSGTQQTVGASPLVFNSPAEVDMDCLHIQTQGIDCGAQVVLQGVLSTYDTDTINQMQDYLSAYLKATHTEQKVFNAQVATQLPSLPPTLQVVPGMGGCFGTLDITNTGSQSIQIQGLGITITKGTMENSFAYHLVDVCTLAVVLPSVPGDPTCCATGCGSSPGCGYGVNFDLQADPQGTHLYSEVTGGFTKPCALPLIVGPSKLVEIWLSFDSSPTNLIYQGVELTLSVSNGKGTPKSLPLPSSFTSTLVFADQNQFSCYGFDGTTFTAEPPKTADAYCV